MRFALHWIPALTAAFLLTVTGFVLRARARRSEAYREQLNRELQRVASATKQHCTVCSCCDLYCPPREEPIVYDNDVEAK